MAIKGIAQFYRHKRHVITSQTDHKCVLDSCRHLQQAGWDVTYLPVQPNGLVDLAQLEVRAPLPCRAAYKLTRMRAGRHPRRHRARVHHGHQQRDRRYAASGRDWGSLPQARRVLSYRCCASHRKSSTGRECAERGRHVHQRSQGASPPRRVACLMGSWLLYIRSTGRRAWAPFTCAGGRVCGLSLSSTAAGRSAACAAGRCRHRWW